MGGRTKSSQAKVAADWAFRETTGYKGNIYFAGFRKSK
jgi:hypothetical protein